ncbi:MAG TPA: glycosyltransferase [Flavobacteriales bacterium]|nr:glycosyltransferase [Flavobacteriales bacterium]HQW40393.1 glycosyltransferase [Flavobacteriales bacterium]
MMKKELWLFTMRYPFGMRESFLENELPTLCERYDRVIIIPEQRDGPVRPMPPGAELRMLLDEPYKAVPFRDLLASPRITWLLIRSLLHDATSFGALRKQWPSLRSRIAQLMHRAKVVGDELMPHYDPARVTVYAYWTHDWATVLGIVKERSRTLRYFSRAHGFDMYEAQNRNGWIPFRKFQFDHVQRIYCASRSGQEHLAARFPERGDLFALARLGTSDHGPGPHDPTGPLKVVSCSFLIPRKRVLLLVEALALTERPVHWVHFGGGVEEQAVADAVARLPKHITVELRGMTSNAGIIEWYRKNPVDVFLHLSQLEGGVAVAIQEAASFGIPVIATDSGGVREIMTAATGLLLDNAVTAEEVAALLDDFRESPMGTAEFRAGVRAYWNAEFNAAEVYQRFVDRVESGT